MKKTEEKKNTITPEVPPTPTVPKETGGTIVWEKMLTGLENCQVNYLLPIPGGGCILAGYTSLNNSGEKPWIVKINGTGQLEWEFIHEHGTVINIKPVKEGGYLAVVMAEKIGEDGAKGYVPQFLKLNEPYGLEWESEIGKRDAARPEYVLNTIDNGFLLAGTFEEEESGEFKVWIRKLDTNGNLQYVKIFGEGDEETIKCLSSSRDGSLMLGCTLLDDGSFQGWVKKFDLLGNVKWNWPKEGKVKHYMANHTHQDNDGSIVLAGTRFVEEENSWRIWLMKLDSHGKQLWNRLIGAKNNFQASFVSPTPDKGYILTGETWSESNASQNAIVMKVDSNGSRIWVHTYSKEDNCVGRAVYPHPEGGYFFVGSVKSSKTGRQAIWLCKLTD